MPPKCFTVLESKEYVLVCDASVYQASNAKWKLYYMFTYKYIWELLDGDSTFYSTCELHIILFALVDWMSEYTTYVCMWV